MWAGRKEKEPTGMEEKNPQVKIRKEGEGIEPNYSSRPPVVQQL
jgi:hypothetical protein